MNALLTIILYICLTSGSYYLGSQATITSWLWNRYPARLDDFMRCAACSGFWYGLGLSFVVPGPFLQGWQAHAAAALCSLFWTPLGARWLLRALRYVETGKDEAP